MCKHCVVNVSSKISIQIRTVTVLRFLECMCFLLEELHVIAELQIYIIIFGGLF